MSETTTAVATTKPGYKTSEWYLTLLTNIVGALATSGLIADGSMWSRGVGAVMMVLSTLGYTYARTKAKA
jgi:hypothetical protein